MLWLSVPPASLPASRLPPTLNFLAVTALDNPDLETLLPRLLETLSAPLLLSLQPFPLPFLPFSSLFVSHAPPALHLSSRNRESPERYQREKTKQKRSNAGRCLALVEVLHSTCDIRSHITAPTQPGTVQIRPIKSNIVADFVIFYLFPTPWRKRTLCEESSTQSASFSFLFFFFFWLDSDSKPSPRIPSRQFHLRYLASGALLNQGTRIQVP